MNQRLSSTRRGAERLAPFCVRLLSSAKGREARLQTDEELRLRPRGAGSVLRVLLKNAKGAVRATKRARNTRVTPADGSSVLRVLLRRPVLVLAAAALSLPVLPVGVLSAKLTPEERIEIMRGLTAEYATVKAFLPRSKKHLPFPSDGKYDKAAWNEAGREFGPAARVGDLIQVTKVDVENDEIKLEINGGLRTGKKWYERIEMGTGNRTTPINNGSGPTAGTYISVLFPKGIPPIEAKEIKKILAPILDFEKRSATENYVESLPEPIQAAIRDKRAVEGMTREQVLIACGRPRNKMRETKDGDELEEWIYGLPPGKITFVVFQGDKVVRVKDAYAGLGGSTADPLPPR